MRGTRRAYGVRLIDILVVVVVVVVVAVIYIVAVNDEDKCAFLDPAHADLVCENCVGVACACKILQGTIHRTIKEMLSRVVRAFLFTY